MNTKPYRCTVISWDVNHNCLGRAHLIAEAARKIYSKVDLIGFGFTHLSQGVWEPLKDAGVTSLPEPKDAGELIRQCQQIAGRVETDVVIACKARLPSVLLGYCIKQQTGARLIIDIDDYEPAFVSNSECKAFQRMSDTQLLQEFPARLQEPPHSAFWTVFAQACISAADGITTCDTSLQAMYGGEIVPHLRDQVRFLNPTGQPPEELKASRARSKAIVMFLGTPQRHKGVVQIAQACQQLEGIEPVYIGKIKDRGIVNDITRACDKAVLIENIPFSSVPVCLALADSVVLLQDAQSAASQYQLPAKACDALAAGVRIIASETPPMKMLVEMGFKGIELVKSIEDLPKIIEASVKTPLDQAAKDHNAKLFGQTLSLEAGAKTMKKLFSLPLGRKVSQLLDGLIAFGKPSKGRIILLLWKQNDFGVFGRRVDMVAKYLASRKDVSLVIVIEKPLSVLDLQKYKESSNSHFRLIYDFVLKKRVGLLDGDKLVVCAPVMPAGLGLEAQKEFIVDYCHHQVKKALTKYPGASIGAWIYPYYRNAIEILDGLPLEHVVADIVDDHRQWPNLTEDKKAEFHGHYQQVLERADLSIYNCERTMQSVGSMSKKNRKLIPNGTDTDLRYEGGEEIDQLRESLLAPGNWLHIIGYAGNLESKIDWDLVTHLADKNKDSLLLMIGSTHMAKNLPERKNIKYVGPMPYDRLKQYLQLFDVAIIPHLTTQLTEAMNPLKAYVYATLGIPIIATNCPNLPDMPQLKIAEQRGGFTKRVRAALNKNQELGAEEIYEIMRIHSWESRLKTTVDRLHG